MKILNNKLSIHSEAFHVLNKNNQKIMQLKFISNKNIKTSEFVNFVKSKIDLQKIKITSIKNHEDVEIYPLIINWNKEFNFFILTLENINESAFDEQTIEKLYFSLKDSAQRERSVSLLIEDTTIFCSSSHSSSFDNST